MNTYKSNRWNKWMRGVLDGDKEAYSLLLTNLRPWLVAYYRKRINPEDVEDLVQETLMKLHNKKATFDPQYPFGPWIAAIARYSMIDYFRARKQHIEVEFNEDFIIAEPVGDNNAGHDISKLLKLVPPAQAEVIDMVKLQQFTVKEVAEKTGHSIASVKVMVHRGLKKMAEGVNND